MRCVSYTRLLANVIPSLPTLTEVVDELESLDCGLKTAPTH